jgi:tetratricopeptide (TPR) repeat protein
MARHSSPPLIVWVLVGLLALTAMGSIAWGAFIVYTNRQAAIIKPSGMAGYLKRDNLEAAILLRELAGMPDEQVLTYALTTGKTESAFAIAVFGDALSDPERAGAFASLGRSYASAGDPSRAAICYQALVNIAALGAGFHDYQRANLLLQAGDGLGGVGKSLEAEEAFDRVGEIARLSPSLPAAVRVQLLQTLAGKYTGLGRDSKAVDAAHSAQAVSEPSADTQVTANLPAVVPNWGGDPSWDDLLARQADRLGAASELITSLEGEAADQVEPERLALEQALLAEDQAQAAFYTQQRAKITGASARLALARMDVTWQTLKWRVAARGFGLALVPTWELSLPEIESGLRTSQEDRYVCLLELAALLPDPLAARQATVNALVEELELGRLGLYPGAPERGLAGDLTVAIGDRVSLRRDDSLFVVPATRNGGADIGFAFATADQLLRQ